MPEDDHLVPMVSVRIGKLNKTCQKKGIKTLKQTEVRNAVSKLGIGKCINGHHLLKNNSGKVKKSTKTKT